MQYTTEFTSETWKVQFLQTISELIKINNKHDKKQNHTTLLLSRKGEEFLSPNVTP